MNDVGGASICDPHLVAVSSAESDRQKICEGYVTALDRKA